MSNSSLEIKQLKLKIFALEAHCLANAIRLRAFQSIAQNIWSKQGADASQFQPALRDLEKAMADSLLRSHADTDPTMASILKQYLDAEFK